MAPSAIGVEDQDWGGYVEIEPPPEKCVFEIGLVMAGAISAGAYTAGVIDFLIEALDSWEAAKRQQAVQSPDPLTWNIPGHRVRIRVVSGASAGSMTGAIAALALKYEFPHVRDGKGTPANPLYKAWVKDIDISKLLQTRDLQEATAPVVSILDSTALPEILREALDFRGTSEVSRPYIAPAVRYIFTQGNLRGIPYFLELPGNINSGQTIRAFASTTAVPEIIRGASTMFRSYSQTAAKILVGMRLAQHALRPELSRSVLLPG
jgi:hypothetical protein